LGNETRGPALGRRVCCETFAICGFFARSLRSFDQSARAGLNLGINAAESVSSISRVERPREDADLAASGHSVFPSAYAASASALRVAEWSELRRTTLGHSRRDPRCRPWGAGGEESPPACPEGPPSRPERHVELSGVSSSRGDHPALAAIAVSARRYRTVSGRHRRARLTTTKAAGPSLPRSPAPVASSRPCPLGDRG
jgi:hypothetical protein